MSVFLMNMINRHIGLVDKVQPRSRSMFEPESAPLMAANNAFANTVETRLNENRDRDVDSPSLLARTNGMAKSASEKLAPTLGSDIIGQSKQTDTENKVVAPNSPAESRIELMNEQIKSLLERLGRKPEPREPFSDPRAGLGPSVPEASGQTVINPVANEQGLTGRIEETLRRLTSQASHPSGHDRTEFEDPTQRTTAPTFKTEADPLPTRSGQTVKEIIEPNRTLHKPIGVRAELVNTARDSSSGTLHVPAWLSDLQAYLNTRLRAVHVDTQAESVINVTIGRVEIRAVNPEPSKAPGAQAKPKGVLSLDDYLKQRESKGRA